MNSLLKRCAVAGVVLSLAACGGDTLVDPPAVPSPHYVLTGDTVATVGSTFTVSAQLADTAGAGLGFVGMHWGSSDPAVAGLRCCDLTTVTGDARAEGIATISVSSADGALRTERKIRIVDNRPIVTIALGQEVTATVTNGVGTARYALALSAGDTVDLRLTQAGTGGSGYLSLGTAASGPRLMNPDSPGSPLVVFGTPAIAPAVPVTATGQYLLSPFAEGISSRGTFTPGSGTFTFVVRRSAPVFAYRVLNLPTYARAGSITPARDSVYLFNMGTGTLPVTISGGGVAVPGATSVSLTGPLRQASSFAPAPAGATLLTLASNGSALAAGTSTTGTLDFGLPPGTWVMPPRTTTLTWGAFVYDQRIDLVRHDVGNGIAAQPGRPVYVFAGADLSRLDTTTLALTKLFSASAYFEKIALAPDGTLYGKLGTPTAAQLLKSVDGAAPTYIPLGTSGPGGITVIPDGTVYAFAGSSLLAISPAGAVTTVASLPTALDMAYHPDGGLYYARGATLYRFDLARKVEEVRGTLSPASTYTSHVMAVDAQGRLLVIRENISGLQVVDTNASLVTRLDTPETTMGVVPLGTRLFGVGNAYAWRSTTP